MSVGTTTAILIAGGITAGATVGGAAIASHGNTEAAKTGAEANTTAANIQAQSAEKALALQKQLYEQQRTDLGPYRGTGYLALGRLTGQSPQALSQGANTVAPSSLNARPTLASQPNTPVTQTGPNNFLTTGGGQMAPPTAATNQGYTPGHFGRPRQPIPAQGMATVRSPDGETKSVPAGDVAFYVSRGATVLPGVA